MNESLRLKPGSRSQMSMDEADATFKQNDSVKRGDEYTLPMSLPEEEFEESETVSDRVKKILQAKQKLDATTSATKSMIGAASAEVTSRTAALESEIAELRGTITQLENEVKAKESQLVELGLSLKVAESAIKHHRMVAKPPPEASKELLLLQQENADLRRHVPVTSDGQRLTELLDEIRLEREINDELRRRLDKKDDERLPIRQVMIEEQRKLNERLRQEVDPILRTPFGSAPGIRK